MVSGLGAGQGFCLDGVGGSSRQRRSWESFLAWASGSFSGCALFHRFTLPLRWGSGLAGRGGGFP
jgi:hypothetical protein